jgi:uncharacterized protein (TIGR02145 family)
MKKRLVILFIFCLLKANAQPYSISFSGTGLSTVKVQNLTTNLIVDVPSGFVLQLSTSTYIPEDKNTEHTGLKVYPNPATDKSTLEILPPLAGYAIITVYNITGKVLTKFKDYLEKCTYKFCLSGLKDGLYIINIEGNGYQFSEKLISNGKSVGTVAINRVGSNNQIVDEKKSTKNSKGSIIDMDYHNGERLKFTAVSGNNSTVITDIPTADKIISFTFTECKDGDNNYYPVVQIGTQLWMAENLKTTKFNNGTTSIPDVTDQTEWAALTTPAYCWYDNNEIAYKDLYGALYNWFAVNTGNLCPIDWHVPADSEWSTLLDYLKSNGYNYDGTNDDYKAAKTLGAASGWNLSSTAGSVGNSDYPTLRNATGFTALPGGLRYVDGFSSVGYYSWWWTATIWDINYTSARRVIIYENTGVYGGGDLIEEGQSVRCVKN